LVEGNLKELTSLWSSVVTESNSFAVSYLRTSSAKQALLVNLAAASSKITAIAMAVACGINMASPHGNSLGESAIPADCGNKTWRLHRVLSEV
jgi:hypothetical protein